MWQPKHTEFRHKDFYTARTAKEIYGTYLTFEDPLPWYKREKPVVALACVSLLLLAFSIYKGVM